MKECDSPYEKYYRVPGRRLLTSGVVNFGGVIMLLRRIVSRAQLVMLVVVLLFVLQHSALAATATDGDILGIRNANITRIELFHDDLHTHLQKEGDNWVVLEPVSDRADQDAVNDLVRRLSRLTIADELTGDSPVFGFDPPQATIRVATADGQVRELLIGNLRSPVSLFVKAAGDDVVYAISNVTLANIGEYPMGFVDGTLVQLDAPELVQTVQVQRGAAEDDEAVDFLVRRVGGSAWTFAGGEVAFDVEGFFRAARLVQATGRLPDDETSAGRFYPTPGAARITVGYTDGSQQTIDVGVRSEDGHHYYMRVTGRDDIYLVPAFHAEHLVRQATAINGNLLVFNEDEVRQLRVKIGGDRELAFDKNRDGVWESNRSVVFGFPALLEAVASVSADRRVADDQEDPAFGFGTDPNAVEVHMTFQDNNTLGLSAGKSADGDDGIYLKTTMRPGVYVGGADQIEHLKATALSVRTQLFPVAIDDVVKVRIQTDGTDVEVERDGDRWLKSGSEVAVNQVSSLVSALHSLSADSLPPVPDDESELGFYPAPGGIRVTITFADGFERYLDVGAGVRVGSGWFATTSYYVAVSDLEGVIAFVREQAVNPIKNAINALK